MPAYATSKVSALNDIAIYTVDGEDKPLVEVFNNIRNKENGGQAIEPKSSNNELKTYFETIMPEYDQERVYVSDMKKVIQWYNLIQKLDMLHLLDEKEETETNSSEESTEKE